MNNNPDCPNNIVGKILAWFFPLFFSLVLIIGLLIAIGGLFVEQQPAPAGPPAWIITGIVGMAFVAVGAGGLIWLFIARRYHVSSDDAVARDRVQMVESLLAQQPPRQDIPSHFITANALRTSDKIGFLVAFIMFPFCIGTGAIFWFTLEEYRLLFWVNMAMSSLIPIIGSGFAWAVLSRSVWRRRLLKNGRLVEGRIDSIRTTNGWAQSAEIRQYEVSYTYPWDGKPRQATQIIHDVDGTKDYDSYPANYPVRLLVSPRDPKRVLWVEATLLSDPLPHTDSFD